MDYRYVVLRHQPSLYNTEREGFAVLVEGKAGEIGPGVIFIVGLSAEPKGAVSELTKDVLSNLGDILRHVVEGALRTRQPGQDFFDAMSPVMLWNIQMSEPTTLRDEEPIHRVAFKLFSEHVAGADQSVKNLEDAAQRMVRLSEVSQQLGHTFLSIIPAQPVAAVAAD